MKAKAILDHDERIFCTLEINVVWHFFSAFYPIFSPKAFENAAIANIMLQYFDGLFVEICNMLIILNGSQKCKKKNQ